MMTMSLIKSLAVVVAMTFFPLSASAQPTDPKDAVKEIAALTADMAHFDAIRRVAEDLVFWQSVAIMGGEFGWTFAYNSQATEIEEWTYRLYNSLDETLPEGIQSRQAIKRSRVLTDEEKQRGEELFLMYEEMHSVAQEVYVLLKDDDVASAAALFEERTLNLRREISRAAASSQITLRDRIRRKALDVRLGK